jgi:hypothetical protein
MPQFMSQDLFNTSVVHVAWLRNYPGVDSKVAEQSVVKALSSYVDYYSDDDFQTEMRRAVDVVKWAEETEPGNAFGIYESLRRAVTKYRPDGRRKGWKLIKGLWFTSERSRPPDRFQAFIRDMMMYYAGIQCGRMKIM